MARITGLFRVAIMFLRITRSFPLRGLELLL